MSVARSPKVDVRSALRQTLPFTFGSVYGRNFRALLHETQPMAYVEMAIGLGLLVVLNVLFFRRDNWGYFDTNPHPFWFVILPIAARYGALPGYVVGFLSAILYLLFVVLQPRTAFVVDILSVQALLNPVLFIVVGASLGELREAQKRARKNLAERYDEVEAGLQDLAQRYLAAVEINKEMERRIVTQTSTVTTLYQAAKGLEKLDIEELAPAALELVTNFIEAESCALYLREEGRFRYMIGRPEVVDWDRPSELDPTRGMIAIVVGDGRTVTVRDVITEATPSQIMAQRLLMATPLVGHNQEVIGILTVEKIPFLRFTPTAVKLFTLLGDWASTAFQTALRFQETRDRNVADDLTGAYNYTYMTKRLADECERVQRYGIPLSVLALRIGQYDAIAPVRLPSVLSTLGLVFQQNIRGMDTLGKGSSDDVFLIVLPHVEPDEARARAARIQREIEGFGFKPYDNEQSLAVHVGLASAANGQAEPRQLLERAVRAAEPAAPGTRA